MAKEINHTVTEVLEALKQQTLQRGGSPSVGEIEAAIRTVQAVKRVIQDAHFDAEYKKVVAETHIKLL